jgi:hypothetical protein
VANDLPSRFTGAVTQALQPLGTSLVEALRQLVAHNYPKEVVSVDFVVFSDGFTRGFPVRAFFLDETNTEHFVPIAGRLEHPSAVDPGLLQIDRVYDNSLEASFLEEDDDLDVYTLAAEALIPWFAECWRSAGGPAFDRSATITIHDDHRVFDLVESAWVEPDA